MNSLIGIVLFLLIFGSTSHATVISGSLSTLSGNSVNLSGLEWLSFDDATLPTFGVSRDLIDATNSAWALDRWRYASELEASSLFSSLGLDDNSSTNEDGISFLLDNWGSSIVLENSWNDTRFFGGGIGWQSVVVTRSQYMTASGIYGDTRSAGGNQQLPDGTIVPIRVWSGSTVETGNVQTVYFPHSDVTEVFREKSPFFIANLQLGNTGYDSLTAGSYLVRAPAPVPEPSTMLLLGSGLVGLAFYRRRAKK